MIYSYFSNDCMISSYFFSGYVNLLFFCFVIYSLEGLSSQTLFDLKVSIFFPISPENICCGSIY